MITISDHQHLRTQIHEALKTMKRAEFAQKANVQYSKLEQFLEGQAVSDPTFRKLSSALPHAELFTFQRLQKNKQIRKLESLKRALTRVLQ